MHFLHVMECIVAIFIFRLEFGSADCRLIETLNNGRVVNTPTFDTGSSIDFECNPGYEMLGQGKMICQADGQWNPSKPPTCEVKTCGDFGIILHGDTFQEESRSGIRDSYGSIVHVTCNSGYILEGPLRVMCQADGTWGIRPNCISSKCPPYPGFNSSCIDKSGSLGTFLFFICREDVSVTRTGPDGVECIGRNWEVTDVLIACYCDCKINADLRLVSLNNAVKGYIGHTSTLDWACKEGYKKNVTEPLVCNDGLIGTPACVPGEATHAEEAPVILPPAETPTWIIVVIIICFCVLCTGITGLFCYLRRTKNSMRHDYVTKSEFRELETLSLTMRMSSEDSPRRELEPLISKQLGTIHEDGSSSEPLRSPLRFISDKHDRAIIKFGPRRGSV